MPLKPSEEIQASVLAAAMVYSVFSLNAPNLANVKAAPANNAIAHGSVKTAAWTSALIVSGVALLAKSPTIFTVGSAMIIAESWKFYHANATDPATGKLSVPSASQAS